MCQWKHAKHYIYIIIQLSICQFATLPIQQPPPKSLSLLSLRGLVSLVHSHLNHSTKTHAVSLCRRMDTRKLPNLVTKWRALKQQLQVTGGRLSPVLVNPGRINILDCTNYAWKDIGRFTVTKSAVVLTLWHVYCGAIASCSALGRTFLHNQGGGWGQQTTRVGW